MAIKKVSSSLVSFYCENELAQKVSINAKAAKLSVEDYIITVLEADTVNTEIPKPKPRARKTAE